MKEVSWATPLYEFLRQCNATSLDKVVLDCGAGGDDPPLSLFYRFGYRTYGVEIAQNPLRDSRAFCQEHNMPLNIFRGDMRHLPFASESFSFVYSFNAVFFMTKPGITLAICEMERVLVPNGLLYVNFVSVDDPDNRPFCETAPARTLLGSEGFAKHEDDEADAHFARFQILRKEKKFVDKVHGSGRSKQAYVEYIARKHPASSSESLPVER